jgi:MraZ protein
MNKMFIGEYQHALDPKNRIIIPSKFRDDLGNTFVMTKGLDGCLYGYPKDEWERFEEKLKALPLTIKTQELFLDFSFQELLK